MRGTSERSAARNAVAPSVPIREEVLGTFGAFVEPEIHVRAPLDDLAHELKARQTADPISASSLTSLESGTAQLMVWSGVNPVR